MVKKWIVRKHSKREDRWVISTSMHAGSGTRYLYADGTISGDARYDKPGETYSSEVCAQAALFKHLNKKKKEQVGVVNMEWCVRLHYLSDKWRMLRGTGTTETPEETEARAVSYLTNGTTICRSKSAMGIYDVVITKLDEKGLSCEILVEARLLAKSPTAAKQQVLVNNASKLKDISFYVLCLQFMGS